jgi:sulfoxide reductase heme-binding subunit YedZ
MLLIGVNSVRFIAPPASDNLRSRVQDNLPDGAAAVKLAWPWQDRQRRFSALKAAVFALMFAPAGWLAYQLGDGEFGIYPLWLGGVTYWSGVWATAVLLLALAVTPALTILNWRSLIAVRRMIGVAALVYTIGHLVVYFALRFWNLATIAKEMTTNPSLIAATLSTIGLLALGLTSVDAAIARMGVRDWQRLHNTVYVISALALLHALLSRGSNPMQYLLSGIFFWLVAWRVLDRYGRGNDARALAVLAVATCLFVILLEAACVWLKRGYPPLETLGNNFTLIFGIPLAWELLAAGLLIALAAVGLNFRLVSSRVTAWR